jgi:hypothetical protein
MAIEAGEWILLDGANGREIESHWATQIMPE